MVHQGSKGRAHWHCVGAVPVPTSAEAKCVGSAGRVAAPWRRIDWFVVEVHSCWCVTVSAWEI